MYRSKLAFAMFALVLAPVAISAQPDVIVGDLPETNSYGNASGIYAYSVGTTSCNIGSSPLLWQASTSNHPVIGQEMYRLKNGVLEQIGISWLKHGFCALQLPGLCPGCAGGAGCLAALGPGCSDPYSASLNGTQSNLGPRSQVNSATGVFPYPFSAPPFSGNIDRRLQVHAADLDPAQNAGAQYFVTGQYIHPEDAAAGVANNNASYRRVTIGTAPATYAITLVDTTQQQSPGIQAWQDNVPAVTLVDLEVPNDGLFIVGYNVTNNGNGTWHYEYAIFNMNSDRAANSFQVQFPGAVTMTNIGFHDVDHHSGELYSSSNWNGVFAAGVGITWQTDSFAVNQNANAIRWGTMYNFRFDADAPPAPGLASLGLFEPGTPTSMLVNVSVPNGSTVPAVTNLSCIPAVGQVNLAWTNGDVYDAIQVRRGGTLVATLAGSATSYADIGVPTGSHTWDVRGVQGGDASFPVLCSATVTVRVLSFDDLTAFAGQAALQAPVLSEHSSPLEGFTLSVQYPNDRLSVADWTIAGTATEVAGAEFAQLSSGSNYLTAEVLLDSVGPFAGQTIPSGTDVVIARAVFAVSTTVVAGETRTLAFVDGLGPAGIDNTVQIGGIDQIPVTDNATITFQTQPTFIRGNCNGDPSLNIVDAVFMLGYMFSGGVVPSCFSACDGNDDGALNIVDAIYVLNYLFVPSSPLPPAPFPNAGPDPTPDALGCS